MPEPIGKIGGADSHIDTVLGIALNQGFNRSMFRPEVGAAQGPRTCDFYH